MKREDIVRHIPIGSIGVELGVATGQFSARLLATGRFSKLYSIDAWKDGRHNAAEMYQASKALEPYGARSQIIRGLFADVVHQFADNYFDFIYIDGYAHTGQERGRTLLDWWPKLKPGGLFAGDDYSVTYPRVIEEVDIFTQEHGLEPKLHEFHYGADNSWGQCPSWYVFKS